MTCLGLTAFLYQFSVQIKLGWQGPKEVTVWRLFGSPQKLFLFCYFGTILSGDVHNKKKYYHICYWLVSLEAIPKDRSRTE